jgi:thioredoxin reductase (NADPH)
MNSHFDLIIVGGGITGMTAAIYAARANIKTLLLEKMVCGGLVNSTHVVENFPSYQSINGMDLMEKVREHVDALGVPIIEVIEIESVDLKNELKTIVTDEGQFQAPAIILATGRTPRKLKIDCDFEQIHYCAICDGSAYKDKDVIVVGGGNSGVDESLYLLGLGVRSILLVEEFDKLLASEKACNQLKDCPNVEIMTSTRIEQIHGNGRLESITLCRNDQSKETRNADGIFVYIGQDPQTDLFHKQIDLDANGYIQVDDEMKTCLSGVFCAGDVIRKKYRQITTAMGDGTIAALSAIEYLTTAKRELEGKK